MPINGDNWVWRMSGDVPVAPWLARVLRAAPPQDITQPFGGRRETQHEPQRLPDYVPAAR